MSSSEHYKVKQQTDASATARGIEQRIRELASRIPKEVFPEGLTEGNDDKETPEAGHESGQTRMPDQQQPKRLPADSCLLCDKSLEEVGGQRLYAQRFFGIFLSNQARGGGHAHAPDRPIKVSDAPHIYLILRGPSSQWTEDRVKKARAEVLRGRHPWFCQVCGGRTCSECAAPLRRPVASDILHDDGSTAHVATLGGDAGCMNPTCRKYRTPD